MDGKTIEELQPTTCSHAIDPYWANIYVGLRAGYGSVVHHIDEVRAICAKFCDQFKLCVTITPTEYVYVDGGEPGVIVGLIRYPRFIVEWQEILRKALALGEILRVRLDQKRVTIMTPERTVLLGDPEYEEVKL